MPTYDYACAACDTEFTVERSITDDSSAPCPQCGAEDTRRQISRTSFVLKGGGWYEDGYGSSGGASSSSEGSSGSSGSDD